MARLSYGARKALPKKAFALPSHKTAKNPAGRGAYPIPDAAHARNALARVSQHGSASEKATVRAKVHAKYPGIQVRNAPLFPEGDQDKDFAPGTKAQWNEPMAPADFSTAPGGELTGGHTDLYGPLPPFPAPVQESDFPAKEDFSPGTKDHLESWI